jgi:hypothetical protein
LLGKQGDQIKWSEPLFSVEKAKDDGIFPTFGFRVFKLDHPLPIGYINPSQGIPDIDSLILRVQIPGLNLETQASAIVPNSYKINIVPSLSVIYLYGDMTTRCSLGATDCDPSKEYCYRQIEFRVHYKNHYDDSTESINIFWKTYEGWGETEGFYQLTPGRLFNRMKMLIPSNENVISRALDSIDIAIINPNRCYSDWWQVKDYWENSDNVPYSNFSNSYGLFFTYLKGEQTGLVLNRQAMDTLCYGYNYKEMRFRNW